MPISRRAASNVYVGTLAEFTASTRIFSVGSILMPKDSNEVRVSTGKAVFASLTSIPTAAINKAAFVSQLTNPATLTAIGATFADLAAARASVFTLQSEVNARLTASDNKVNAILTALKAAGIMLPS